MNPEKIVIPREEGLVKSHFTGNTDKLIIHIQDAHCNFEAQTNIAKIIETLIKNDNLSLVSVEGADGLIDTTWFKAFPDEEVRKEVAAYFMKKGEITGPEYLSITTDLPIKLFGAETRSFYIENLNAFTSSYPLKADTEKYFNSIRAALHKLKDYIYSSDLRAMDARKQDYESKKIQFNDYIRFLREMAEKNRINLRQYENLFKLISVLAYEKKIDFTLTDKERNALIDELSKKLPRETLTELVAQSMAFKVGKISSTEYYSCLRSLAMKNDIDVMERFPNLYNYIVYNAVYSKIENEKLFHDIANAEAAIKEKLFANDDQRTLEKLSRHIDILLGLVNIKLLNGDFDYFKTHKDEFAHGVFAGFIQKKASRHGLIMEIDEPSEAVAGSISKLEDFYAIAIKRDKALVGNTLNEMARQNQKIAVLVTGGFHSEGISRLLEKEGVSYVVVCPNITKDVPTPYIQILTNQRTPIEDILMAQPDAKKSMLAAPLIAQFAPLDDKHVRAVLSEVLKNTPEDKRPAIKALIENIIERVSYFRKNFAGLNIQRWMMRILAAPGYNKLGRQLDTMKDAYELAMRKSLEESALARKRSEAKTPAEKKAVKLEKGDNKAIAAVMAETRQAKYEGKTFEEIFTDIHARIAAPGTGKFDKRFGAVPAAEVSVTDRATKERSPASGGISFGRAYSSINEFQTFVETSLADLARIVPEIPAMAAEYSNWRKAEVEGLEEQLAAAQNSYWGLLEKSDSVSQQEARKILPEIERLSKKIEAMIKEKTAPINNLIVERYNSATAEALVGPLDNLAKDNVVTDIPTLEEFMKSPDYPHYLNEARKLVLSGAIGDFDVYAGASTRLFGTGQKTDPTLSFAGHDVYDIARREGITLPQNAIVGLNEMTRIALQKWLDIETEIRRSRAWTGMSEEDIQREVEKERKELVGTKPWYIIINDESGLPLVKSMVAHKHYGFNPEMVVFGLHPTIKGYEYDENGKPRKVETTRPLPLGHGFATLQIVHPGNNFWVDANGHINMIKEDAETYLRKKTGVQYFVEGRANDMLRLGYSVSRHPSLSVHDIDMGILALSLKLMGNPDDPAVGLNAILEQVGADPKIKGGSPLTQRGKKFLIEGLAQRAAAKKFVTSQGNPMQNRFYIIYKWVALREMKRQGLPVYLKFVDGYFYPDTVTGDLTMLDGLNAGYAMETGRRLCDYKDRETIDNGFKAAVAQDGIDAFRRYAAQELERPGDVVITGLEALPELRQAGVGAVRARGGELTAAEHGTRGAKAEDVRNEASVNGAIADLVLKNQAYALIKGGNIYGGEGDVIVPDIDTFKDIMGKLGGNAIYTLRHKITASSLSALNIVVLRGLKEELMKRGVAADLILHPGVGRRSVYIDEGDFLYLLSLSNGADLVMEALRHELAHINNPDMGEDDVEKLAPTTKVRAAFTARVMREDAVKKIGNASIRDVLDNPDRAFEISIPDLVRQYETNVKWAIDRMKKSTAGTRGILDKEDILGGPQLNAAVIAFMAQGYADYINSNFPPEQRSAFIGFDPRYFSKEYARIITRVFAANGIRVYRDVNEQHSQTPVSSYMAYHLKLACGIEVTSSHNPPNQNGIKSMTWYGGVDTDDVSARIASRIQKLYDEGRSGRGVVKIARYDAPDVQPVDAKKFYYENYMSRLFDEQTVAAMKTAMDKGARFVFDGLFGVGGPSMEYYLDRIFAGYDWRGKIIIMNAVPDSSIGGIERPDPSNPRTLELSGVLERLASTPGVLIAVTADMDADRIGTAVIIPDKDVERAKRYGLFVSPMKFGGTVVNVVRFTPNQIFTLIAYERVLQAYEQKLGIKEIGAIRKAVSEGRGLELYLLTSIPTSSIAKQMIETFSGTPILTTVGFKNLGYEAQRLDRERPEATIVALMEESGGATIAPFKRDARGSSIHRDKDTIVLALALFASASRLHLEGKNMLDLYVDMAEKLGGLFYYERIDAYLPNQAMAESLNEADQGSAEAVKQAFVQRYRAIDNIKEPGAANSNLDNPDNVATLASLFGKRPEDIVKAEETPVANTVLLVGEGEEWQRVQPVAKRFTFRDNEVIEVFHTGRDDQEGPSIAIYNAEGRLKARSLLRASGTESLIRVYLEIFEPQDNPSPENLYRCFMPLLQYLGLQNYSLKTGGRNYLAEYVDGVNAKYDIEPPAVPDASIREKTAGATLSDDAIDAVIRACYEDYQRKAADGKKSERYMVISDNGKVPEGQYSSVVDIIKEKIDGLTDHDFAAILGDRHVNKPELSGIFNKKAIMAMLEKGKAFRLVLIQPKEEVEGVRVPGILMTETGANFGHYSTKNNCAYLPRSQVDTYMQEIAAAAKAGDMESKRIAEGKLAGLFLHEIAECMILSGTNWARPNTVLEHVIYERGKRAHYAAQLLEQMVAGPSVNRQMLALGVPSRVDEDLLAVWLQYLEDVKKARSLPAAPSPLLTYREIGEQIWLDGLTYDMLQPKDETSDVSISEFERLVRDHGITGVTTNPALIKAYLASGDVRAEAAYLAGLGLDAGEVYFRLISGLAKQVINVFRRNEEMLSVKGKFSVEISPEYADNFEASLTDARRWLNIGPEYTEYMMVKVPANEVGCRVIRAVTAEGGNVNATLIFTPEQYKKVATAYIAGLEDRLAAGQPVKNIYSVASFFVSRWDTGCFRYIPEGHPEYNGMFANSVAIEAYNNVFVKLFRSEPFKRLQEKGARIQDFLLASTGSKAGEIEKKLKAAGAPADAVKSITDRYPAGVYVTPVQGSNVVNTLPLPTINYLMAQTIKPERTIEQNKDIAGQIFDEVEAGMKAMTKTEATPEGIGIEAKGRELFEAGMKQFADAFSEIQATIAQIVRAEHAKLADLAPAAGLPVKLNKDNGELILGEGIVTEPKWVRTLGDAGESIANPDVINDYNRGRILYYGYRNAAMRQDAGAIDKQHLRFDITVLLPGVVQEGSDDEFIMTKGHTHDDPKNPGMNARYPEIYEVWSGYAMYVQQGRNNGTGGYDVLVTFAKPGDRVLLKRGYSHRTVNIGSEPLVMANWISEDVNGKKERVEGEDRYGVERKVGETAAPKVSANFKEAELLNGYAYHVIRSQGGINLAFNDNYSYTSEKGAMYSPAGPRRPKLQLGGAVSGIPELGIAPNTPMYGQFGNQALADFLSGSANSDLDNTVSVAEAATKETIEKLTKSVRECLPGITDITVQYLSAGKAGTANPGAAAERGATAAGVPNEARIPDSTGRLRVLPLQDSESLRGISPEEIAARPEFGADIETGGMNAETIDEIFTRPGVNRLSTTAGSLSINKKALAPEGKVIILWDTGISENEKTNIVAQRIGSKLNEHLGGLVVNERVNSRNIMDVAREIMAREQNVRAVITMTRDETLSNKLADGTTVMDMLRALHAKSRILSLRGESIPVPVVFDIALRMGFEKEFDSDYVGFLQRIFIDAASGKPIDPAKFSTEVIIRLISRIRPADIDTDSRVQAMARDAVDKSL